jgi:hypothetical protein
MSRIIGIDPGLCGALAVLDAQSLVVVACPDCEIVLPTVCNCTQSGLPYCGRPDCDIDWCWYCGDEYTDPCPRHEGVDHV